MAEEELETTETTEGTEESTSGETSEEETEETSETTEESEQETTEETDSGAMSADEEADWLKDFGLPEEPKTVDEALEGYKKTVQELNQLKQQLAAQRKIESVETPRTQTEQPKHYLTRGQFGTKVKELIDSGAITGDDNQKFYRQLSQMQDGVLNATLDQVERALEVLAGRIAMFEPVVREQSYQSFRHKGLMPKEQLDAIAAKLGTLDYNTVILELAKKDSGLMERLVRSVGNSDGQGKRRPLRRQRGSRIPVTTKAQPWKGYVDRDGNLDTRKLESLPIDNRLKILKAYQAHLEKT